MPTGEIPGRVEPTPMSGTSNSLFSGWPTADAASFLLSLLFPLVVGVPLLIAFLLWSLAALLVLGIPLLILEAVFGQGLLTDLLLAAALLVWMSGFCLGCAFGYIGYVSSLPRSVPSGPLKLVWWAVLPVIGVTYAVLRAVTTAVPDGVTGFLASFCLLVFAAYLLTSRARSVIGAVRPGIGLTVTTVVTGFVLVGGTIEALTYLIGSPLGEFFAENGSTRTGMVATYLPVVLLALFAAWTGERLGIGPSGAITNDTDPLAVLEPILFDVETGDGVTTAIAIAFVAVPLGTFAIEVTARGFLRSKSGSSSSLTGRWLSWCGSIGGTLPHSVSRSRPVVGRLSAVVRDTLRSIALLPLEACYAVGYTLSISAGVAVVAVLLLVAVTLLDITASLLAFSGVATGVIALLRTAVVAIGFLTIPVAVAVRSRGFLTPPDGELLVEPSEWTYPVVLPAVGVGLLTVAPETVLPPWNGVGEQFVAGALVAVFLYRGASYSVVTDRTLESRYLDSVQRRVLDRTPDGTTVGPLAFAGGVGWLATAAVVAVLRAVSGPTDASLLGRFGAIPLVPPPAEAVVGLPIVLGGGLVVSYGTKRVVVGAFGRRQTARNALDTGVGAVVRVARRTVRWVEYGVLLRP